MVLRQPDGTETEQTLPVASSRVPTVVTNDGQEVQLSDENQLQMISTIVEQAAAGGLGDGNNQVSVPFSTFLYFYAVICLLCLLVMYIYHSYFAFSVLVI